MSTDPFSATPQPARLMVAALVGLLCAGACGGELDPPSDSPQVGVVTSSKVDPTMTIEKMTAMCDALGGKVERHPHCGGANSCKGMSYDVGTEVFTEHTCRAANTCTGYSCVVP